MEKNMQNDFSDNSYFIADIIDINKKKKRIILESSIVFSLYVSELEKYQIKKGGYLQKSVYHGSIFELLLKRAKLRAINLLTARDMTEYKLRTKLKEGYYPEEVIEPVIGSLRDYGYIDDKRYTENYIQYHGGTKSRYQLTAELRQKGIDKELISDAMSNTDIDFDIREKMIIKKLILRRNFDILDMNLKDKQKVFGYLSRKGFSIDLINCVINEIVDK